MPYKDPLKAREAARKANEKYRNKNRHNPEMIARRHEHDRKYRNNNRAEMNARKRAARLADPERFRKYDQKKKDRHPDKIKQRSKRWYRETRDERLAYAEAYRAKNREEINRKNREYSQRNRELIKTKSRMWRELNRDQISEKKRAKYAKDAPAMRAAAKQRRIENPGKTAAQQREYRKRHPERFTEYAKRYAKKHPERLKEFSKKYAAKFKERIAQRGKAYRELHRTEQLAYSKKWRAEHPDICRQYGRKKRERDPEKYSAYQTSYRNLHREKSQQHSQTRSQRMAIARSELSTIERRIYLDYVKSVRSRASMACYWCNRSTSKANRQLDHIVPISKGGKDCLLNLCVSCKRCNHAKKAMMPSQFSAQQVMTFHSD